MRRPRPWRWLAALPAAAIVVGVPCVGGVRAHVFGLPFLLAWMVGCVLLTTVVMGLVTALDAARDREERGAGGGGGA